MRGVGLLSLLGGLGLGRGVSGLLRGGLFGRRLLGGTELLSLRRLGPLGILLGTLSVLYGLLSLLGVLFLLQHTVGHLAHQCLGQLLTELDVGGHGVLGDVLAAVVQQLLLAGLCGLIAGLEHHECLDPLYLDGVLDADDAAEVDVVVAIQNILQLGGIDVVTVGDDHALDALTEVDKALLVHHAQVAGVDPGEAVGVGLLGLGRLLRMVDVLQHHGGAGQADLALLTVGDLLLSAGLDDLVIGVREGNADGALLLLVDGGQAAGGDALGGAIALPDADGGAVVVEELVKALLQLNGQTVTAGEHTLQAAEVGPLDLLDPQQRLEQGGDAGDEIGLVLLDELGVALRGEAGDQDAVAAVGHHGVDGHAQSEAVEHGHDGQHLVTRMEEGVGSHDLGGQSVKVAVGEQDALGDAGGAAGVEDGGGIGVLALDAVDLHVLATLKEILPQHHAGATGDLGVLAALGELIAHPQQGLELIGHGPNGCGKFRKSTCARKCSGTCEWCLV